MVLIEFVHSNKKSKYQQRKELSTTKKFVPGFLTDTGLDKQNFSA